MTYKVPIPFNNEAKEVKATAMKRQCDVNTTTMDSRRNGSPCRMAITDSVILGVRGKAQFLRSPCWSGRAFQAANGGMSR